MAYPQQRKLGRKPPHSELLHPRLKLGDFLTSGYSGTVPPVVDYLSLIPTWPMALNDRLGCCTASAACHMEEVWSRYGQGTTVIDSDADVLTMYEATSGYNPADPATDQGAVMQDVLDYWRKTGLAGHRIAAFFHVDHTNLTQVKAALYLFGGIYTGINFPRSAMQQFDTGHAWDYDPNADNTIEGGHCIHVGAMSNTAPWVCTSWGRKVQVTPAFWDHYTEEAWAPVSLEWVRNYRSPTGVDTTALNTAFQQITGQPGPFPLVPPTPAPTPVPATNPDAVLVSKVGPWASQKFHPFGQNIADAINAWRKTKGV